MYLKENKLYEYKAVLEDGSIVIGNYESNGSKKQHININGANVNNKIVSIAIKEKETTKVLRAFKDYEYICRNCGGELTIEKESNSSWIEYKECKSCGTKVEVQEQDRMSGTWYDPLIVITYPNNEVEEIKVEI